jgi:hypothetical protein
LKSVTLKLFIASLPSMVVVFRTLPRISRRRRDQHAGLIRNS